MTKSKELFNELVNRITLTEDKSEIQSIVYLLLEKTCGLSKTEILVDKEINFTSFTVLDRFIEQINAEVPVQYILEEALFYGRTFKVTPATLIPRPETELLIHEICKQKYPSPRVLDIGTGSGCIAITLALEISNATVYATDVSTAAMAIAQHNANSLGATINIYEHNILSEDISFNQFDLIVSNPPYISQAEKNEMKRNVLDYEPHVALFAPAHDPLAFYKAIAEKSKKSLTPSGAVWVEINEHFGNEVATIFKQHGFGTTRIIKDLDQKDRIVMALAD